MVRIHPDPPGIGAVAQFGRAPALQAGGRRFDPDQLHHTHLSVARADLSYSLWARLLLKAAERKAESWNVL